MFSVEAAPVEDAFGRPLKSLRLSVTDRCNLRCNYCMPEASYAWLPKKELFDFDEIVRMVKLFSRAGVDRLRITGGEPLLRRDLPKLVRRLRCDVPALREIALTTNGILLDQFARPLREAGLDRITVSLDTLDPVRFQALSRRDEHGRVLR
ncbi:MAG: radical SAM protein, partial [Myxococcota bacterium]